MATIALSIGNFSQAAFLYLNYFNSTSSPTRPTLPLIATSTTPPPHIPLTSDDHVNVRFVKLASLQKR
ncbi:hypothetical protein CHS0354_008295, partial [Potamilus streckersoni]